MISARQPQTPVRGRPVARRAPASAGPGSSRPHLARLALLTTLGRGQGAPDPVPWLTRPRRPTARSVNYTAIFHKQQRIGAKLLETETISSSSDAPSVLYMRWIAAPYQGSELLYATGWNENRARVHRGGLLKFITRNLDPQHARLMSNNLASVHRYWAGHLVNSVAVNVRKGGRAASSASKTPARKRCRPEGRSAWSRVPQGAGEGLRRLPADHQPGPGEARSWSGFKCTTGTIVSSSITRTRPQAGVGLRMRLCSG